MVLGTSGIGKPVVLGDHCIGGRTTSIGREILLLTTGVLRLHTLRHYKQRSLFLHQVN